MSDDWKTWSFQNSRAAQPAPETLPPDPLDSLEKARVAETVVQLRAAEIRRTAFGGDAALAHYHAVQEHRRLKGRLD